MFCVIAAKERIGRIRTKGLYAILNKFVNSWQDYLMLFRA